MTDLNVFIASMPKVELHLHIEGSLEPEMLFDLGKRNAVALPFASAAEVRQAYNFRSLQDFLDIYVIFLCVVFWLKEIPPEQRREHHNHP